MDVGGIRDVFLLLLILEEKLVGLNLGVVLVEEALVLLLRSDLVEENETCFVVLLLVMDEELELTHLCFS
jgi:hypothetical protein